MRSPRISDWAETCDRTCESSNSSRRSVCFRSKVKRREEREHVCRRFSALRLKPRFKCDGKRPSRSAFVCFCETFSFIAAKRFVWFHRSFSHCESFCWSQSLATASSSSGQFLAQMRSGFPPEESAPCRTCCRNIRPQLPKQTKHISYHEQIWVVVEHQWQTGLMVTNYRSLLLPHENKKWIKSLKTTRCDVKTSIVFCNVSLSGSFFCCVSNTLPWKPKINQTEILFFPFRVHSSTLFLEIRKHFGNVFGYKIIDGIFQNLSKKFIYNKIQ